MLKETFDEAQRLMELIDTYDMQIEICDSIIPNNGDVYIEARDIGSFTLMGPIKDDVLSYAKKRLQEEKAKCEDKFRLL